MRDLKIKEKIQDFILRNPTVRRLRKFFNLTIFPYLQKALLISLLLIIVIFSGLKMFKPQYLDKIYANFSAYFFQHLNLNNYNFSSIDVKGNKRVPSQDIIAVVEKTQSSQNNTSETLIRKLAKEIKEQLPWVNQINISRTLPNKLNIAITEYEPFAIWQNLGQKYVIDKDGNKVKIDDDEEFKNLIILSGKDANLNVKSLFNIFTINPELSTNIYSATWIGDRRWDIRLENGLLVKLPASNIQEAWRRLIKIYNTQGSLNDLKVMDLRIDDKIYLQYGDDTIKEIKNFKL